MEKLKTKLLLALLSVSAISCTSLSSKTKTEEPPVALESGYKWERVESLCDDFDTWDNTKWTKSLWNYGEPVNMQAENSGVADGKLWIKATLCDGDRWFQTSRVMSRTRVKFPVYIECRMIAANISAFSTFWLNNGNHTDRDEIDICESNPNPSRLQQQSTRPYTLYSQYFVVNDGVTERDNGDFDNRKLSDSNPAKGMRWNEDYHVLGAWWSDKNTVQFYINGEKAGKVTTKKDFTLDLNVIWDLWTDDEDWTGGLADKNDLGNDSINTMYVDYIRTYKPVKVK